MPALPCWIVEWTSGLLPIRIRLKLNVTFCVSRPGVWTSHSKSAAWHEELKELRLSTNKLIWFDMRDSAGTTQFEVMPFVDRYVKKQIYRDPQYYFDPPYGGRAYSQFYNRRYGVTDRSAYQMTPLLQSDYSKLCLGWNIGTSSSLARSPRNIDFMEN